MLGSAVKCLPRPSSPLSHRRPVRFESIILSHDIRIRNACSSHKFFFIHTGRVCISLALMLPRCGTHSPNWIMKLESFIHTKTFIELKNPAKTTQDNESPKSLGSLPSLSPFRTNICKNHCADITHYCFGAELATEASSISRIFPPHFRAWNKFMSSS